MKVTLVRCLPLTLFFSLLAGCPSNAGFCGDGDVQRGAGEECDDGNGRGGDGCDARCVIEEGCGDGFLDSGEECDDGNINNGDGCNDRCDLEAAGTVSFQYVLLEPDVDGTIIAAPTCDGIIDVDGFLHDIAEVRLMVGDDFNGDGVLDDDEVLQDVSSPCNQEDFNRDGIIEEDELGIFQEVLFAGSFDLFAVEFIDTTGDAVLWETYDTTREAERFSYGEGQGFRIIPNTVTVIPFVGDETQLFEELQAFFGI